jgi:hypothetical protein
MPCDIRVNTDLMIISASPFCVPSLRYGLKDPRNCSGLFRITDAATSLLHGLEDQGVLGLPRPGCRETIPSRNTALRYKVFMNSPG